MLTSTFLHIPGVGPATERGLWERGIHTWDDYFNVRDDIPFSQTKREHINTFLCRSQEALEGGEHKFFAEVLASREHWRAFPEFGGAIAYLDIETTGMGAEDEVTMVGVYDGSEYRAYVKDIDLHQFPADIGQYSMLATFFGTGFDLPFLRRWFVNLRFDQLHVDLCFLLRRLGYSGGLKKIEEQLDIPRSAETKGLDGFDAVRLWREYERGSEAALELLVKYNMEDVMNLEGLMRLAYGQMRGKLGFE